MLKLEYDEPALWRAGKCFAELRQLAVWFSGYTASGKLADLAITLDLAITGLADTYREYHNRMVVQPQALAAAWARYYAGFCLLGLVTLLGGLLSGSSTRFWMPPVVLFASALFTRCGWEVQIERSVRSRLRYAINCGIVNGLKRREQTDEDRGQQTTVSGGELHQGLRVPTMGLGVTPFNELATTTPLDVAELERGIQIAAELVELPPPWLPYGFWWGLHALRCLRPFRDVGYLPLIHNEVFREWLLKTDHDLRVLTKSVDAVQGHQYLESREYSQKIDEYDRRLNRPRQAVTHSRVDRVLWSSPSLRLALIFRRITLVDSGARYFDARSPEPRDRDDKSFPTLDEWRRRRN
jgi:hypothetical protein